MQLPTRSDHRKGQPCRCGAVWLDPGVLAVETDGHHEAGRCFGLVDGGAA